MIKFRNVINVVFIYCVAIKMMDTCSRIYIILNGCDLKNNNIEINS